MILDDLRGVLAGTPAWLVGGAVRDRLLGRATGDYDVALVGDVRRAAHALRTAAGGAAFPLSERFGAWRVVAHGHAWTVDVLPLKPGGLEDDLAARDFTINAMAEPLAGGDIVDPHGGAADLEARRVRMVSERALQEDPLRAVRAVRFAVELGFEVDGPTLEAARRHAPGLDRVSAERIFAELKRIVGSAAPAAGIRLAERAGVLGAIVPELLVLRGVEQNVFHHLDAYDHTLDVLAQAAELERSRTLGEAVHARLSEPFADGLTRWGVIRWGALLHDIAKPQTRGTRPDGRVTFLGHDEQGAGMAASILRRLRASERLVESVIALTRHHLHLGFLVHRRPLDRRDLHRYLKLTEPYEVEITVLTVADRLATRGKDADRAIEAHLQLAREVLGAALQERPAPLVRGDDLIHELGIQPGPRLGEILAQLEEDAFAGDIATREDALRRARELVGVSLRDQ